ncbi:MAG: phage tail sheath subtilisin-like domain-containing protein, partial [Verrucomicrobiales bacterium]|nr:phage tail sheath subtilisin-like domain-containing protein [Verrucomicrobiales bacterium]
MEGPHPRRPAGIRFEAQPAPSETLPRMDIAVFVGFASRGPIDRPVVVEDFAGFREVFGPDLALAWSTERRAVLSAQLSLAVRGFFENGGRRCWVIRVARDAETSAFPVSGLLAVGARGVAPAFGRARSAGCGADSLVLEPSFRNAGVRLVAQEFGSRTARLTVAAGSGLSVRRGDLLALRFADPRIHFLSFVGETPGPPVVGLDGDAEQRLVSAAGYWVVLGRPSTMPDAVRVEWTPLPGDVRGAEATVGWPEFSGNGGDKDGLCTLGTHASIRPEVGEWLKIEGNGTEGWVRVESSRLAEQGPDRARSEIRGRWVTIRRNRPHGDGARALSAGILRMDLRTRGTGLAATALRELGLCPDHVRYWNAIPSDDELFAEPTPGLSAEASNAGDWVGLWQDVRHPRFEFAGDGDRTELFLPIGALLPFPATAGIGARYAGFRGVYGGTGDGPSTRPRLEREGLASMDPSLFLDPDLKDSTAERLVGDAEFTRDRSTSPRRLRGIHAALEVEEATLLAVPDAMHPRWEWVDRVAEDGADRAESPVANPSTTRGVEDEGRVFRECAVASPQSVRSEGCTGRGEAGTRVPPGGRYEWRSWEPRDRRALVEVHRAMLRMAAARGDLLAVLGLPAHFRETEALEYVARLRAGAKAGGGSGPEESGFPSEEEARVFSYGAMYHPWLWVVSSEHRRGGVERTGPEGAVCGVMAKRAADRGAWIAPANEPLRGVVDLDPEVRADRRTEWLEARINLVRRESRGFLVLGADTLSEDEDLGPISVRRLLILLRRLALRHGMEYVFEPGGPQLER